MLRRSLFFVFAMAVLVHGVGCGPSVKLKTVPVSGTVTYNGQPIEGATVVLVPAVDGSGRPAGGDSGPNGKFTLQTSVGGTQMAPGAIPGEYKVTVSKLAAAGGAKQIYDPNNPSKPPELTAPDEAKEKSKLEEMKAKASLPEKYSDAATSGLTASIKDSGSNELTFDLKD